MKRAVLTSALPPKAAISGPDRHVRYVPTGDIHQKGRNVRFGPQTEHSHVSES